MSALVVILVVISTTVGASMMPGSGQGLLRTVWIDRSVVKLVPIPPGPSAVNAAQAGREEILSGLLTEHRCLAEALYFEARGEGTEGEKAVAEVVFHRMANGNYGNSIFAVVYEGVNRAQCQFSFACDGSRLRPKSETDWYEAQRLAAHILTGQVMLRDETGGAVNYHAVYVRPRWAREFIRTAQIGNHIFYRAQGVNAAAALLVLRGSTW